MFWIKTCNRLITSYTFPNWHDCLFQRFSLLFIIWRHERYFDRFVCQQLCTSLPLSLLILIQIKHTEVLLVWKGKPETMFDSCHMSVSDLIYRGERKPDDTNDCSSFNSYQCDERSSQQTWHLFFIKCQKTVNKNHVRWSPTDNLASLEYYSLFSILVSMQLQRFQPL